MTKLKCLFSAPSTFIDKKIFLKKKIHLTFKEIWSQNDLSNSYNDIVGWIPNPGQNFIINSKILEKFPNLKLIVTPSTGNNHINLKECLKKQIKVFSLLNDRKQLKKITSSSEFTFLLALNSLRRLDFAFKEVDRNRWRQNEDQLRGREIYGKKIGIIGLGRIGLNLAKWFNMFRAEVFYYDKYVDNKKFLKKNIKYIFKNSDLICICCSLNKQTINLIDKDYLFYMKKNSILINTSRGEVINEKNLIKFLNSRKDIFYTSDVLKDETNGKHINSKLIDLHKNRRVLITPHIAGATIESQSKAAEIAINLLIKYL